MARRVKYKDVFHKESRPLLKFLTARNFTCGKSSGGATKPVYLKIISEHKFEGRAKASALAQSIFSKYLNIKRPKSNYFAFLGESIYLGCRIKISKTTMYVCCIWILSSSFEPAGSLLITFFIQKWQFSDKLILLLVEVIICLKL